MSRVGIITGAARGIGKETAMCLADDGMKVALFDRDENVLAVANNINAAGGQALAVIVDVAVTDQILEAIARVRAEIGTPDTVVNNAALAMSTQFLDVTEEEWDAVFDVNLKAGFVIVQKVIAGMMERGFGRIINISSMAGIMGSENTGCHYCASKAGVIGLTKYLSKCYAKYGITANAIAPGPIDSELSRGLGADVYETLIASMPQHQLGTPESIAAIAAFLASKKGGFITGTVIEASGGQIIV